MPLDRLADLIERAASLDVQVRAVRVEPYPGADDGMLAWTDRDDLGVGPRRAARLALRLAAFAMTLQRVHLLELLHQHVDVDGVLAGGVGQIIKRLADLGHDLQPALVHL